MWVLGTKPSPLQEQQVFLSAEPSLQPQIYVSSLFKSTDSGLDVILNSCGFLSTNQKAPGCSMALEEYVPPGSWLFRDSQLPWSAPVSKVCHGLLRIFATRN